MITDDRAQEAFQWLNANTGAIGIARAELERSEILRKRARKRAFVDAPDGSTVAAREALAELAPFVLEADDRYIKAVEVFESMKARQQIETIALDVWRTESANRRRA